MGKLFRPSLSIWSRGIVLISAKLLFFCNMASSSSSPSSGDDDPVVRLGPVMGDEEKTNEMLFSGDLSTGRENIVYFGGDVQDFAENMSSHRDNKRHIHWCFENTARLLGRRFPRGNIWIVRPSTMYLKTMSVFYNFVDCNEIGTPSFSEDNGAIRHLSKLLLSALGAVRNSSENTCYIREMDENIKQTENSCSSKREECGDKIVVDNLPITLIGFSKGCVVLNQIIHELHLADSDEDLAFQISRIAAFYWLDGGHMGNSNTWIKSDFVLQRLEKLKAKLFVHITPYQMDDQMRYWIAKEEKKFVSKLQKFGADIVEKKHFEGEPRSIEMHFRLLEEF